MDVKLYQNVINTICNFQGLSIYCLKVLYEAFPSVNKNTLYSILSFEYQQRMKLNHTKSQTVKNKYFDFYNKALKEDRESLGIIMRIAKKANIAPCLVAKLVVEKYLEKSDDLSYGSQQKSQFNVNIYLRNTTIIDDINLAYEVFLCTLYDNLYSPLSEVMKNSVGQQYEIKLHKEITNLGLAFRDEEYLRKFGYDKTPDVKLDVPISVNGFIVHWIESKALFGNEELHMEYKNSQYLSYWNRFGPGLVIYWFSFLETIVEQNDKRFIICDHLPLDIQQLDYTT